MNQTWMMWAGITVAAVAVGALGVKFAVPKIRAALVMWAWNRKDDLLKRTKGMESGLSKKLRRQLKMARALEGKPLGKGGASSARRPKRKSKAA